MGPGYAGPVGGLDAVHLPGQWHPGLGVRSRASRCGAGRCGARPRCRRTYRLDRRRRVACRGRWARCGRGRGCGDRVGRRRCRPGPGRREGPVSLVRGRQGVAGRGRRGSRRRGRSRGTGRRGGGLAVGNSEVLTGGAYGGMLLAERGGPGGGHPGVVAAGLVPVAQFLGDPGQVEGQGQHQRVGRVPPPLASRVRLLQHPPGGGRIVSLPVQPREQVRGAHDLRVVLTVRGTGRGDRVGEQPTGRRQVTGGTQGEGPVLDCGEG